MATYIKGDAVANATSYELYEKVGNAYNLKATASEINFNLDNLNFEAGDHVLVVKAKADGYEDSDYSNEVTYTAEGGETEITVKTNEFIDMVGSTPDAYRVAADNTITYAGSDTSKTSYRHTIVPVSEYEIIHLCCVTGTGSGNYNINPLLFLSGSELIKENVISRKYGTIPSIHNSFKVLDEDIVIPEGCTHIAFGEFINLSTVLSEEQIENIYKTTYIKL